MATAAAAAMIVEGPQDAWRQHALQQAASWVEHVRFWRERHDAPPLLRYEELANLRLDQGIGRTLGGVGSV